MGDYVWLGVLQVEIWAPGGTIPGARRSGPSPTPPIDDGWIPAHVLARWMALDILAHSIETYGSVGVVAVLLCGGPAGSVSVTRCDSLRIRPLRRAPHLTYQWLPAPAWPTSWPDQESSPLEGGTHHRCATR